MTILIEDKKLTLHHSNTSHEISIYIHWPFCKSKCPYCDFNSHVANTIDHQRFLDAYIKELNYFLESFAGKHIKSIFFGGGTPSLMLASTIENIINYIASKASITNKTEISMEANPTSVEAEKLKEFKAAGINRLSIGVQSFNPEDLKFLGRNHSASEAVNAIEYAKKYFDNFSFDLIYGRPKQTLHDWEKELHYALSLSPKHISLYQLTIEKGTAFYSAYRQKQFNMPNSDLQGELYEFTNSKLEEQGFNKYEVSNYALPGHECIHNLNYWEYKDYLGIGPGAHGRIFTRLGNEIITQATMAIHKPNKWLESVEEKFHGMQTIEILNKDDVIIENLLMSLRTKKGLNLARFQELTGIDLISKADSVIQDLISSNFALSSSDYLMLTDKGVALQNEVITRILQCC